MMMEGLVIFNICLWPWLAYWCLVVASLASQLLRSLSSSLSLIIMMMIDDEWWWWWWQFFQIFLIALVLDDYGDDDDDDDNNDYLFRSASLSLSFFCGVLSLASSSKDGVVCYYQSCNCQIICFFSIEPAACIQQVGVRSISLPLPLPMQTKLKFYRSDWLKHSTFGSIVFLAMFL